MDMFSRSALLPLCVLALLAGCASTPTYPPESAPQAAACPAGVPDGASCLRGRDSAKAHYLIVMPAKWSGVLVVHAHGGPPLGEPKASRADADVKRWAITVKLGHAWAGSVFRQGGFAVTTAAEDTDRVRRIFTEYVAQPRKTLLHGQSWGGMVATKAAELFPYSWDGVLLTSGVVAGPTTYDFRLDLRAIYQYLCNNHPRPDEAQYPLWMGLPTDSKLSNADLIARVNTCLGLNKPAAQRSIDEKRRIQTIVDVVRIPETAIVGHLRWGTFTLRDVVRRTGTSPFGNENVRYHGSGDDGALNAGVRRYRADPVASARFSADVDYVGRFRMPVLSAHAINDPTVFVEGQDTLRRRMVAAGTEENLVQAYVDSRQHSYWGDAMYPPLFDSLLNWVENGAKPTPSGIAERCTVMRSATPADCRFVPDYIPNALSTRIPLR
jgi:pimeloyl-ACP methyl ester carboxylesterase